MDMPEIPESDSNHSIVSEPIDGFMNVETGTVAIYRNLYERIFWDLNEAETELSGEHIDFASLIHAAAHLRLVIEGVTAASFTANHVLFAKVNQKMQGAKNFDAMRKAVRNLNKHYWPRAFGVVEHGGQTGLGVLSDTGLAEGEIGRYFGTVSELLHVRNPFAKPRTPEDYLEQLLSLTEKFRDLLDGHLVQLADSSEYLYLRNIDGEIKVQAFRTENPLL